MPPALEAWSLNHWIAELWRLGLAAPRYVESSHIQSGIKPTSPTLAGGFFTTEPPGKPFFFRFFSIVGYYKILNIVMITLLFGCTNINLNTMDMSLSKLRELVMDREAWRAGIQRVGHD